MLDEVANDVQEAFGEHHIATIMFGSTLSSDAGAVGSVTILSVLDAFTPAIVRAAARLAESFSDLGFSGPQLLLLDDVKGMDDSVPDELLDLVTGYQLICGDDVLAPLLARLDFEHIRAQTEQRVRNTILKLRWDLVRRHGALSLGDYLGDLGDEMLALIQLYHWLLKRPVQLIDEHVRSFIVEFPALEGPIRTLMAHCYEGAGLTPDEQLDLAISMLNDVLATILHTIDAMAGGPEPQPQQPEPTDEDPDND